MLLEGVDLAQGIDREADLQKRIQIARRARPFGRDDGLLGGAEERILFAPQLDGLFGDERCGRDLRRAGLELRSSRSFGRRATSVRKQRIPHSIP